METVVKKDIRPLSDMTEEELRHCIYLMEGCISTSIKFHKRVRNQGTEDEFAQWFFYSGQGLSIEEEHIIANLSSGENGFNLIIPHNKYYRCYVVLIQYLLSKGFTL
jgi:hypothetical protein